MLAEQARRLGISVENEQAKRLPQEKLPQQAQRGRQRDLNSALEISNIHQRVKKFMANKGSEPGTEAASDNSQERSGQLPFGWEERVDPGSGRRFYIDHVRKVTSRDSHP